MESATDLGAISGEASRQAPGGKDVDNKERSLELEVLGTCIFRARRGSSGAWGRGGEESERQEGKSK